MVLRCEYLRSTLVSNSVPMSDMNMKIVCVVDVYVVFIRPVRGSIVERERCADVESRAGINA